MKIGSRNHKNQPDRLGSFRKQKMVVALTIVFILLTGALVFLSIPVSRLSDPDPDFDMQVVLGGNRIARSTVAHKLWLRHRTPIVVTGDDGIIYAELLALGVPATDLIHETRATSTWENMKFSLPILKHYGVKRALIVSSWFHMNRVQGCFGSQASGIHFSFFSDPVPLEFGREDWKLLTTERCKSLYYALAYRVMPWQSVRNAPLRGSACNGSLTPDITSSLTESAEESK